MFTLKDILLNSMRMGPKPLARELKRPIRIGGESPFRLDHRNPLQAQSPEALEHPHDTLVKAELEYSSFQVHSGIESIRNNMDPQSAAELQNQQMAMDELQRDPFAMENALDPFHGPQMDVNDPMANPLADPLMRPPI